MFGDRKYGSPQNAITVWKDHMVSQGFGYKLGVDLPGEKRGLIPNAQFYDKAYRGHWNGLTVISISIGQGEILATPLQIANLGATIANRSCCSGLGRSTGWSMWTTGTRDLYSAL